MSHPSRTERTHRPRSSPWCTTSPGSVGSGWPASRWSRTRWKQPYRYTGTYLDPSGLYKMGARYYGPQLGRFTQSDPSGKESNPYAHAVGDSVNRIDPSGLEFLGLSGGEWLSYGGQALGFASIFVPGGALVAAGLTAASIGMEAAGGAMHGKSGSSIAAVALVGAVGGKVGIGAKLLGASKTMDQGIGVAYWAMGAGAGLFM
ncbi:RHS repeat-associated core domain-containing protein [Streptomyces massasporeus]|uniref:RHS repeat-associated core domain-containing protein n=1 Tax=Streptomyces massasporeus TaxID=67324 RepID=UPI0019986110|nr:hypothetical protein GCM10010228_25990 [Streptomyces massasporeus]